MQVVTVTPMNGYVKHAAKLTPKLQKWMEGIPPDNDPWLGFAHYVDVQTLCQPRSWSTKQVYTTPFEALKNEPWTPEYEKKTYNTVCAKCQRLLREMNQKENNDK